MSVKFRIRNVDTVKTYLRTVPYGSLKVALHALTEYIIGNSSHGLRHDEPQKYVSRAKAGYKTSRKQIAFFFATGILERTSDGGVRLNHYKRSGQTAAAWTYKPTNNGYGYTLVNPKAGAYYTRADDGQTRQHELAGRRKVSAVVAANMAGAIRHAIAEVKKFLGNR